MIAVPPGVTVEDEQEFERRLAEHERMLLVPLDHTSRIAMAVDSRLERDMRAHACAKEPETVDWLERELGGSEVGVLYDVGACSGSYSLIGARLGAKVVAFEPSAFNYRQLARNASLNRADITVLPIGLGRRTTLDTIALSSDLAGAAGHTMVGDGAITLGHSVMLWRLDDLVRTFSDLPRPTVMKIDTDGFEVDVLEGATETLATVRSLMVELRSETRPAITDLLARHGFEAVGERKRIAPDTWNAEYRR